MNITYHNPDVKFPPILSVGILTIPGREKQFNKLIEAIKNAMQGHEKSVELISIHSEKGTPKIGGKRNIFLNKAKGQYCVMIDDDDMITENYFSEILPVLTFNQPDCIGHLIDCEFYINDRFDHWGKAIVSNEYTGLDGNYNPNYDYVQGIYYKVPIRTELARKVGFKNISFAEDQDFSLRLKPLLKKETFINEALYIYKYNQIPGETRAQRYGDKTL